MKTLKLSVRQLTEFCCRSGDLGYDSAPSASALEGLRTHQKIQQRYAEEALAEYRINFSIDIDGYAIELGGRIDLLFENETPPRVEEIKTVYTHMSERYQSDDESHWAQVMCYAACYSHHTEIDELALSLNYVNLFNAKEFRQHRRISAPALKEFLNRLLQQYLDWHRLVEAQREATRDSSRDLKFPHAQFREQQRYFAAEVYRNIQNQGQLMVEAPTGSGKTVSTLFPAVKAIGEELCEQIIYLSAKTSGQQQAVATLEQMIAQGLQISYLVIRAKSKCCLCQDNPEETNDDGKCLRCVGFFDRLAAAREELFKQRRLDSEQVQRVADEFQLCSFELSLQMLPWIDVVIGDLNYVFDPLVQLSYFRTDSRRKVLLIDELHNLVDRARGMYSANLKRTEIKQALNQENPAQVSRAMRSVQNTLDQELRSLSDDETVEEKSPESIAQALYRFGEKLGVSLFTNKHISPATLEFAKAVFRYQCIHNLYGEHHRSMSIKPVAAREVRLLCLNAHDYLRATYPLFDSVCGFSATLTPQAYFLQALGLDAEARALRLPSPFPLQNLQVAIGSFIDTRYAQRERFIDNICACINRCFHSHPGNYLVFFSSYFFMQKVHAQFCKHYPQLHTIVQQRDANDVERNAFVERFNKEQQTIGFAIMGGVFAEGIDYLGDALIGAILVGVGLPQANTEQKLIQQDFEQQNLNGFDHAYRFPGLTRVQQSAGRVIRSETDRGVIVLLDYRFHQAVYREHYPAHWQIEHCNHIDQLQQTLQKFWSAI